MHPLEKKIVTVLHDNGLLEAGARVVLAISGGPDSMAMLHLFAAAREKIPHTPTAVYVNHGLRPAEAACEEQLVLSQSSQLGLAAHSRKAKVREYAREHGLSLEHAGRLLRYGILEEMAASLKAERIAVAHTADDQAEEILLRLIRGTGTKGLSGMKLLRDGTIIRPLLNTSKKELLRYLADKRIPFCEDSSNRLPDFLRNRIRHHLLPLLKDNFNQNIYRTLRNTAAILQEEEDFLAGECAAKAPRVIEMTDNGLKIDCSLLLAQHTALQRRLLETAFWKTDTRPSFTAIEQARELSLRGGEGARMHAAEGLRIIKSGNSLYFTFPAGRQRKRGNLSSPPPPAWEIDIPAPGTYAVKEAGFTLQLTETDKPSEQEMRDSKTDYLDMATISFPLRLRSPRKGDRFHPLGAPGRKKVADFLADRKIPKQEKAGVVVLISGDGIVALPGLRIDQRNRVTAGTVRCLAVSLEPC